MRLQAAFVQSGGVPQLVRLLLSRQRNLDTDPAVLSLLEALCVNTPTCWCVM